MNSNNKLTPSCVMIALAVILAMLLCSALPAHAQSTDSLIAMNLEQINTAEHEFSPFLSDDCKTLYFMRGIGFRSRGATQFVEKMFQSNSAPDGLWMDPVEVTRFSKLTNYGGITADSGGHVFLHYTPPNADRGNTDIYELRGNDLIALDSVNSRFWDGTPSISSDGNLLFFTSNRGEDSKWSKIFVSHRIQGSAEWSAPVCLGPEINMGERNAYPFISRDGSLLFFCSNPDHDWLRIYVSTRVGDSDTDWSKAFLLPPPINTAKDSVYPVLSASGKEFFFVSDRKGGEAKYDIYQVHLPHGVKSLLGLR